MHSFALLFLVVCVLQNVLCDTEAGFSGCPSAPHSLPLPTLPNSVTKALKDLESLLIPTIKSHGVSAGIVYRGKKIWEFNRGSTGNPSSVTPTADTLYRVGSISKTFSLALLLKAVQEGKIAMDDPVKLSVPNFNPVDPFHSNTAITWNHLASHTSGLPRFGPCDLFNCDVTTEQILALTSTLNNAPGSFAIYSNYAYALLGHFVAEYVFLKDYYQMTHDEFLQPLNLQNTGFEFTDAVKDRLAQGYTATNDPVPKGVPNIAWYKPAGEMYSSVNDLLVWANELMGYRNGQPGSSFNFTTRTNLFHRIFYSDPNGQTSYGLAWENVFVDKYTVHRKYGSIDGYSAIMGIVSELDLGLVILWNTQGVPSLDLMPKAMEILLPAFESAILNKQPVPPRPADLTQYVGTYTSNHPLVGPMTATISAEKYHGIDMIKINVPGSDATNYLVLPESGEANVLTIWVPSTHVTCQELGDVVYYLERVVFTVEGTTIKSLSLPGLFGTDLQWDKS